MRCKGSGFILFHQIFHLLFLITVRFSCDGVVSAAALGLVRTVHGLMRTAMASVAWACLALDEQVDFPCGAGHGCCYDDR